MWKTYCCANIWRNIWPQLSQLNGQKLTKSNFNMREIQQLVMVVRTRYRSWHGPLWTSSQIWTSIMGSEVHGGFFSFLQSQLSFSPLLYIVFRQSGVPRKLQYSSKAQKGLNILFSYGINLAQHSSWVAKQSCIVECWTRGKWVPRNASARLKKKSFFLMLK